MTVVKRPLCVQRRWLATTQALLQKGDYVVMCSGSMADHLASLGLTRKIAIDSSIRFGLITAVLNRERLSTTLMEFVTCLKTVAQGSLPQRLFTPPSA